MKKNNKKAFTALAVAVIILVVGLVGYGVVEVKKAFAPSKPKQEVTQLDQIAIAAQQAAKDTQAKLQKDIDDHIAAMAAEKAKEQKAAGFNNGVGQALGTEQNPSINVKIAKTLQTQVAQTLDPATQAQIDEFQGIIKELQASNDQTSAKLQDAIKDRDAAKEAATEAIHKAAISDDQAKLAAQKSEELSTKTEIQSGQLKKWADDNITLLGRLKALGIGAGAILIVIPILALAFPGFAPVAKVICAPVIGLWTILHNLEKKVLADLHAKAVAELSTTQALLTASTTAHAATQTALLVSMAATTSTSAPNNSVSTSTTTTTVKPTVTTIPSGAAPITK